MAEANSRQVEEDDITSVIGRFHAWNVVQDSRETPGGVDPIAQVQAISYEEALGGRRVNRIPTKASVPNAASNEFKAALAPAVENLQERLTPAAMAKARPVQAEAPRPAAIKPVMTRTVRAEEVAARSVPRKAETRRTKPGKPVATKTRSGGGDALKGARAGKRTLKTTAVKDVSGHHVTESGKPATSKAPKRTSSPVKCSAKAASGKAKSVAQKPVVKKNQTKATTVVKPTKISSLEAAMKGAPVKRAKAKTAAKRDVVEVKAVTTSSADMSFRRIFESRAGLDHKPQGEGSRVLAVQPGKESRPDDHGISAGDARYAVAEAKSIAMKLRMSPGEHAQIKAGATEAGVTLAAYMRQCTLDVKVLRELLTKTIYDLKAPAASQSALAAIPGYQLQAPVATKLPMGLMEKFREIWRSRKVASRG